ncbi:MAG: HlyD family type I secretion periplasmic adaptor subunit, partial [Nevskiales bacterium]|nr:HlyD family type I secretion periplasmic adaptor subunit [Nevskiales bacterium]
ITAFVVLGLLWAAWAELDEVTRGSGTVVPSSQVQVIQSLEGGIVAELAVREGDIVEKDAILVRIDDTRFSASFDEEQSQVQALKVRIARLEAEASGASSFKVPEEIRQLRPELVASEQRTFELRKHEVDQSVAALKRTLELAKRELAITEPLAKQAIVSEIDRLHAQRDVNDLKAKIDERINAFRSLTSRELTEQRAKLAGLEEAIRTAEDRVTRAVIRSKIRGVVKQVQINTIGGVVKPGDTIMEIVPLDDTLLVRAQLRPSDIAFVRPGQPATVKITAYDYAIYGGLDGKVEYISADTIANEKDERFFLIDIRTDRSYFGTAEHPLPVIPGMTAEVDILTGRKTVLAYLMKPIDRARQRALRER